jgi:NADPH:quinone reductase-like Zn-dependent oxidoreductase
VQSGTELLIVGGGGAVGSAAIQLARLRAARITTFVRPGQEDDARRAGAELVISSDGAAVPAIRNLHAPPFDVVIDLVSKADALKDEASLIKRDGVILTTIHVADEAWFRERSLRAIKHRHGRYAAIVSGRTRSDGSTRCRRSLVLSEPTERPLGDANAVLDGIKGGAISGKVILRP